ncbi:MAG: B12-binding domain-containing radical SAM protein [Candidatus Omnitrophica bacterium]|nr:B12-binding domain-containing radical SAM protein [Candidatus Omnitrophota bacterium]
MNVLLINSPSRKGGGSMLPQGLLYAGSAVEREGHKAAIYDPYLDPSDIEKFDAGDFSKISELIGSFKPSIIGYGGVSTSYGRTKKLSQFVKANYPGILQIAGGPLASITRLLLENAGIDAVFHGEVETSLPYFLDKVAAGGDWKSTPGISHRSDGIITRNKNPEQIKDLDSIPFPAYHLVDVKRYLEPVSTLYASYKMLFEINPLYNDIKARIGNRTHYFPVVTARGCTHRCSFCYRHMDGIRQHSVGYLIRLIKFLMETYGIEGFSFADELFNSRQEWVYEFCDALEREKIDIFYIVAGARLDKMDEKILRRMKDTGCIEISYGQESGSDTILKEYRKGISSSKNRDITVLTTKKVGILSVVQIVIGSPSETKDTIRETVRFLKDVGGYQYSLNYLMPLPGAPIWNYVEENKLIDDLEKYLDLVCEHGGRPFINLTKTPDRMWKRWAFMIRKETRLDYYRKNRPALYLPYMFLYNIADAVLPLLPFSVRKKLAKLVKIW